MARQSRMGAVCAAVLRLAETMPEGVTLDAIFRAVEARREAEQKKVTTVLSELYQAGRIRRISRGLYGAPLATNAPAKREKRQIMWSILRMRKRVRAEDLVEMADVCEDYALEWLRMLLKQGVVRRELPPEGSMVRAVWHLLQDSVEMPECRQNAEKLRELRKKRKESLLQAMDMISVGLDKARQTLAEECEDE